MSKLEWRDNGHDPEAGPAFDTCYAGEKYASAYLNVDKCGVLSTNMPLVMCADESQAKRLAEFARADIVALHVKMLHWLESDNAAPVKSHPIPLASRGADEPIDLASDVGRMLGMGGK